MTDWNTEVKQILRAEITRRGYGYRQLAELLARIGVQETERSIANKISRGTFSATFLVQCLKAMGASDMRLDLRHISAKSPAPAKADDRIEDV
jgi:hypothetical protein